MNKPRRSSTKFTFLVGYVLVGAAILTIIGGFITGAINQTNIVEVVWALLISAATFLGINLTRVAAENISTINAATNASVNPPVADTKVTNNGDSVSVEQGPPVPTQIDHSF